MVKDLIALDGQSRVWIYPSSSKISYDELDRIRPVLQDFLGKWTSHNQSLVAYGDIFHQRFLALFVDETAAGASGCSIDTSVRFVKDLGNYFQKDFFDRQKIHFLLDDEVVQYELKEVKSLIAAGQINEETLFFNHLVKTKEEFISKWVAPIKESWLNRFL